MTQAVFVGQSMLLSLRLLPRERLDMICLLCMSSDADLGARDARRQAGCLGGPMPVAGALS
jgi:hypothetical protein